MTLNTQGLVLHTVNYSETSLVARIFTRQLGERSYLVRGARSAKSRAKRNLLQPMSLLEMTVYENHRDQLQYIKEMQPAQPLNGCTGHPVKTAILFFMNEVVYKAVREEEANPPLFDFLVSQMQALDETVAPLGDYPVRFLLRLSQYLGIAPLDNYAAATPLFHMQEGRFVGQPSRYAHPQDLGCCLDLEESRLLHAYLAAGGQAVPPPPVSRRAMTGMLLRYYALHLPGMQEIRSVEVLHQLLS